MNICVFVVIVIFNFGSVAASAVQEIKGLKLTVLIERTQYKVGEPIPIRYFIENVGDATVLIVPPKKLDMLHIGNTFGCAAELVDAGTRKPIEYQRFFSHSVGINPEYDFDLYLGFYTTLGRHQFIGRMDRFATDRAGLTAGEYYLEMQCGNQDPEVFFSEAHWKQIRAEFGDEIEVPSGTLTSNPIRIKLVE